MDNYLEDHIDMEDTLLDRDFEKVHINCSWYLLGTSHLLYKHLSLLGTGF